MALERSRLVDDLLACHADFVDRAAEVRVVRAPGRVNLVGEHTDYNGGFVLPLAIDLEIAIAFVPRDDDVVDLTRVATSERRAIDVSRSAQPIGDWTDYVAGTAWALREAGGDVRGFTGVLAADLPAEQGLSSSAALELASAWALGGGAAPLADRMAVARACQRAENAFVSMPCGLMDQFAVAFGEPGAALLLDCRSLEHRLVPLPRDAALLVVDSGVVRDLRSSAYAERREACERAAGVLGDLDPSVRSLRDATPALLDEARGRLDESALGRARHVVSENERVLAAVAALEEGDLERVGHGLLASHASLRDDFEVSTPELDELVAIADALPGVFGARLTGAGFGGAVIVLADAARTAPVADAIRERYRTPAGAPPIVRRVNAAAGAGAMMEVPA